MRLIPLATAAALLAVPALAQVPETGPAAVSTQPTTPAPVPSVAPGVPGAAAPDAIPDQVAPSSVNAGPAASTPFSGSPAGQMSSGPAPTP